jgi:hypothetical protein
MKRCVQFDWGGGGGGLVGQRPNRPVPATPRPLCPSHANAAAAPLPTKRTSYFTRVRMGLLAHARICVTRARPRV